MLEEEASFLRDDAYHIDKVEKAPRGSDTLYEVTFSHEQRQSLIAIPFLLT